MSPPTVDVHLVRHADAGARTAGYRDRYRPLSEVGSKQATALAEFLVSHSVTEIHSSPASRCIQTVEPLAAATGLTVIENPALWEDVGLDDVIEVVHGFGRHRVEDERVDDASHGGGVSGRRVVLCSHGNLIPAIIEHFANDGIAIRGRGCERASVWRITADAGRWVEARYYTPRLGYVN